MPSPTDDPTFDNLLEYVEKSLHFQTSSYNEAYLDRRISARMRRRRVEDYEEYHSLLREDEDEQQALLDALSVNVTSFFRNPEVWEALREVLRDLSSKGSRHDPIKVWSAACSDGREAYSLAMLAHDDDRIDERRVEIVGTDIKREILRAARNGEYRASETNDVAEQLEPIGRWERFVERDDDIFRVKDAITDMVRFDRRDLIREDPPGTFDLVVCRNLFIYINAESKRAVFETLGSALKPDGYLTIGMTETIPPTCRQQFDPVEKRLRIYRASDAAAQR
ncbi:protein-glutamate O-methyltransferase CheR [Haloferax mediterranei ATCC 33500]|uniref:protein-glutamate O-methyltransferase n=1 Tax=Haloferax mediterranei (strain ATCC 33500 / DSM 1411 / JCM 8866 / NBRC 14739 / NCIMB 2177 / R-4) TaxID=523841 RepID=I3R3Y4_HALMT|nr:protein-glutamate O-methyltransferase CheR [Haloferax mediterranei]AFK18944.1 chemotaxis protein methyltransferase CheR [Haloferax mediterranei ATCC 33500]AHZ21694.1 chemotaxis protein CheR [Haloferax mediterranei ATCC 33500]EMA03198.1 chemotaxis protein methyltransferase CheR [Haloferax mediterranei ATCC 33500]MDX5989035.1 protein-glutamate O-methyltransferase CheR [Haloferax mediterranei ATCC 33500]QCQ75429.1 protein-glutamate O-methyltransferase CheR [Haloferax mediterranei ATCC 33500]